MESLSDGFPPSSRASPTTSLSDSSGRPKRTRQELVDSSNFKSCDEIVRSFVTLEVLPLKKPPNLRDLTRQEKQELEDVFEISNEQPWRDDWAGNLALLHEEILNPDERTTKKQSFKQPLFLWARNTKSGKRLIYNLIRFVVNMQSTPPEAKRILSFTDPSSVEDMEKKIARTTYDPLVLDQDGWITTKADKDASASGGASWIGEMVRWQNGDAIVLAYVYDADIGDMWKVAWIEDRGLITFDMEVEELQEARKKWMRRQGGALKDGSARKSSRFISSENFSVSGVEEGIVLASSFSKSARQGVYWPARIMHPSENSGSTSSNKRSSSKQKLALVFLAPYWDSEASPHRNRKVEGLFESGAQAFQSGALFQVESVDAAHETIQPYPFDPDSSLDIDQVRNSFRFTGLPKSVFSRFLDSHRLAMGLKLFARTHAKRNDSQATMATAGLFETHPLAVRAPILPLVVLHLPYQFILSQLPSSDVYNNEISPTESVLKLSSIVDSMKPPKSCGDNGSNVVGTPNRPTTTLNSATSTPSIKLFGRDSAPEDVLHAIVSGLPHLQHVLSGDSTEPVLTGFVRAISGYILALEEISREVMRSDDSHSLAKFAGQWAILRNMGEHALPLLDQTKSASLTQEWRVAAERMYRHFVQRAGYRNQTLIVTDWHCNGHLTNGTAFERCVRLPAALKGAKLAGLGRSESLILQESVSDKYLDYVESTLLHRAHEAKYLDKIKSRCDSVQSNDEVVMLTADSDGRGGEDTRGSRGTWKASVCAVAAAVTAVDKVVSGEFVNAFCATRPPGHHAGRTMHAMKAVSNGFCVLNPAACAAIHAVTPVSQGGSGLDRVCVIDFDVHHGNGTQDILCSTYDPRFFYISIHAGGSHVNGLPPDEDLSGLLPHANKQGGIYPGRCGDTSPHQNVLNIPLGQTVTPHAVGSALISRITPAIERFSPNLIILSAGFDAHKHDPMGLGTLSAQDFGHITEVTCQLATRSCSGRLVSVLEGGYGIPCCRPQKNVNLTVVQQPETKMSDAMGEVGKNGGDAAGGNVDSKDGRSTSDIPMHTPVDTSTDTPMTTETKVETKAPSEPSPSPQPSYKIYDLGDDLPEDMDDQLPAGVRRLVEKCHLEGFTECVKEHVGALANCRVRK